MYKPASPDRWELRLEQIAALEDGWDRGERKAVSERTIKMAKELLTAIDRQGIVPPHSIIVAQDEAIDLQWVTERNILQIAADEDGYSTLHFNTLPKSSYKDGSELSKVPYTVKAAKTVEETMKIISAWNFAGTD